MEPKYVTTLLLLSIASHSTSAAPVHGSFLVDFKDVKFQPYGEKLKRVEEEVSLERPVVHSLDVTSRIRYRFASTEVVSRLVNAVNESREASFTVQLPESAFITNFTLKLGNRLVVGEVKEKEVAATEYEAAVSKGQTAAHVGVKPRETSRFQIRVNMAPMTKLTFKLEYQELLERKLGSYMNVINIHPGQVVRHMRVTVHIEERRRITDLVVPPIAKDLAKKHVRSGFNEIDKLSGRSSDDHVDIRMSDDEMSAVIEFKPDVLLQAEIGLSSDGEEGSNEVTSGINGQFAVIYDVERTSDVGEVYVYNGYFVHFFAPTDLEVVNKHVVFVLDVSGSMSGTKMRQMKEAMNTILDDLNEGDYFNILTFSSRVSNWRDASLPVNPTSVSDANEFVDSLVAGGNTNINDALLDGITYLSGQKGTLVNMLIFLTDGQPTSAETNLPTILENIRRVNSDYGYPIYSLAFGNGADYDFLQKMSLQNGAFARQIYEDSDAVLQLKGFYDEISSPLLADVSINYLNDTVERETIVKNKPIRDYYRGCEVIVMGRLVKPGETRPYWSPDILLPVVEATDAEGERITYTSVVEGLDEEDRNEQEAVNRLAIGIERMWAYLTIKELLNKEIELDDEAEKEEVRQKALDLSLKYNFVTPLTSMVVTLPGENITRNPLEDVTEDVVDTRSSAGAAYRSHGYSAPRFGGGLYMRPAASPRGLPGAPAGPLGAPAGPLGAPAGPPVYPNSNNYYYDDYDLDIESKLSATTTTTPAPTTTTPPPACEHLLERPDEDFDIFYDTFADFLVRGHTSSPDPDSGEVHLSEMWVMSRSLSLRIHVTSRGAVIGGDVMNWGGDSVILRLNLVDVTLHENTIEVSISDALDRLYIIEITAGEGCLRYSILSDRYTITSQQ